MKSTSASCRKSCRKRQRPDGIYEVAWTDDCGKERRKSLKTRDPVLAEQRLKRASVEILADKPPESPTVATLLDTELERLIADPTRPHFKVAQRKSSHEALKARLGHYMPHEIAQGTIDAYIRDRLTDRRWANHANATRTTGTVSESTIRRELTILRSTLNQSHKRRYIAAPVVFGIPARDGEPRERWLTHAEVSRMIDLCQDKVPSRTHLEGFIRLSIATAARKEAVLGLTWDQIHLPDDDPHSKQPYIDILTGKLSDAAKSGWIDFGRARGNKRRPKIKIANNPPLIQWILTNKPMPDDDSYSEEGLKRVITYRGEPVKDIKKSLSSVAREAGLKEVSPHTLKHTSVTWMVMSGIPLTTVSLLTGTSAKTLEKHYNHHRPDLTEMLGGHLSI